MIEAEAKLSSALVVCFSSPLLARLAVRKSLWVVVGCVGEYDDRNL